MGHITRSCIKQSQAWNWQSARCSSVNGLRVWRGWNSHGGQEGSRWVASLRVMAAKRVWVRNVWHPPAAPLWNNFAPTARLAPVARQNCLLTWRRSRTLTFTPPSECDQLSPRQTTSGLYSSWEAASYGCTQWRTYGEKWVGSLLNKHNFLDIFLLQPFSLNIFISFY